MRRSLLAVLVLFLCGNLMAQTQQVPVKFDAQIRVRGETDGRDFNNNTDLNTFTLLRTRLGALVSPLTDVDLYIQIEDSRAFGQEIGTLANTANLDAHQAFFQVRNLWGHPLHLKAGRQEMVYGNERLIGAVGWSNVGRSFDAIKLTLGDLSKVDLFSAIINESSTPVSGAATPTSVAGREDMDFTFWGAYYQYRSNPDYSLDLYTLYESNLQQTFSGENDLNRATVGTYNKGKFSGHFDFETELAIQFGKRRGQDVLAFMLTGSVGYLFPGANPPSLRVGVDYLSGMDVDDKDYKVFDTLFATNHKFYGYMDYFVNIPVNTNGQGLQDVMIKANMPLGSNWNLNANFHNFSAAQGNEKDFGNELDLLAVYRYNPAVTLVLGFSFFIPGDLMKQAFGDEDPGVWSFSSLLVSF